MTSQCEYGLFYSPSHKKHYWNGDVACYGCNKKLIGLAVHKVVHGRRESDVWLLCNKCVGENKSSASITEFKLVIIDAMLPSDCIPILIRKPILVKGELDVFEAASLKSDKTVDNTKYANRESFEGARIGRLEHELIEIKDKPLSQKGFDSELKRLLEAKPMLPKQLENREEGDVVVGNGSEAD